MMRRLMLVAVVGASACNNGPECGDGATEQRGACVSRCAAAESWDGQACAARCAAGSAWDVSAGVCRVSADLCGPGTTLVNGVCEPSIVCGPGTHEVGGNCVADPQLPSPDVTESLDALPRSVVLPLAGARLTVGGTVDTPVDETGDGYADPDWDGFAFMAQAGTYLRIHFTSEGAALPAFMIMSSDPNEVQPFYSRYAVNLSGTDNEREVFLPRTGMYELWVTDLNNMLAGVIPVGGDEFTYYGIIERLAPPVPTDVGSLPLSQPGDLSDNALRFFSLRALAQKDVISVSSTALGSTATPSDLYPAVLVCAPDGTLVQQLVGGSPGDSLSTLFSARTAGDYLVVQDFWFAGGPRRQFSLTADRLPATDCSSGTCQVNGGALATGERRLLRFDLNAHDLMVFKATVPAAANDILGVALYDSAMQVLGDASAGSTWTRWQAHYADVDDWVYMVLAGWSGNAVASYNLDTQRVALPQLTAGQVASGLTAFDFPADTLPDGGVAYFTAQAGQIALFSGLGSQSSNGAWTLGEEIDSPSFAVIGPAIDATAVPLAPTSPTFAYLAASGDYLYIAKAANGADLTGATYGVRLDVQSALGLGTLTSSGPLSVSGQQLDTGSGAAFFTYSAGQSSAAVVSVTPAATGTLVPEVSVLSFGFAYAGTWYWSPTQPQLGLRVRATAPAAGQPATANDAASAAGLRVIMVRDSGGSASDPFSVTVGVQ